MNLKIYSNFVLNHLVAYFPFRNLYTFCMPRVDEEAANQKTSVRLRHI